MKNFQGLLLIGLFIMTLCSFNSFAAKKNEVTVIGIIKKQVVTTYQYGTHILIDKNKRLFALKSSIINLDKFIGKNVKIHGVKIVGYPLEGGPDFLNVSRVELIK